MSADGDRARAVRALFTVPPTGSELRALLRYVRDVPASDAGALRAALLAIGVRPARLLVTRHPGRPSRRGGPPPRRRPRAD